jgi:repressor LexA
MHATLTERQRAVLRFIEDTRTREGCAPTLREIAAHFQFSSPNAAQAHVRALRAKGALAGEPGKARTLRATPAAPDVPAGKILAYPPPLGEELVNPALLRRLVQVPLYGSIPAGFADAREAGAEGDEGCIAVDIQTLGLRPTARTFALRVRGDSMIGRHICDGDIVICEHGVTPRPGAIVAALIDNENTLKTFVLNRGRPFLKAENPRYPDLIPAHELVIQGVVVTVIRTYPTP